MKIRYQYLGILRRPRTRIHAFIFSQVKDFCGLRVMLVLRLVGDGKAGRWMKFGVVKF